MRFTRPLFPILPLTGLALLLAIFVPLCKRRAAAPLPSPEEPPAPAAVEGPAKA